MNRNGQNKNKKKPNGFFLFSLAFKKQLIERGHEVHQDMRKIMELAAPHWEKLDQAEKEEYKEKSRFSEETMNFNQTKKRRHKMNCFMPNINELEEQQNLEKEKHNSMVTHIKLLVTNAMDLGELDELVFYFISTSSFYENHESIYPAELALAKFSLKEGVFDDIQIRINPGELPLGSRNSAQEKSEKCLKYPLPPNCEGETDYMTILKTMLKFLHPMKKLPIFFTDGNTRNDKVPFRETCKVIEKIFYESQEDDVFSDIKVYPIDELFFALQCITIKAKNRYNGTTDSPFPSIFYAANKLNGDSYHLITKGCEFHNDADAAKNCCLSKVRSCGYIITKWCATGRQFQLQEGRHFPCGYISMTSMECTQLLTHPNDEI